MLKCHLKGITCSKLAKGLKFYDLKKKLTPGVALTWPLCYIHVYYHSSQTSLLFISQVSGVLLQDKWSSCYQVELNGCHHVTETGLSLILLPGRAKWLSPCN